MEETILASQIGQARTAGYSDDEIINFLSRQYPQVQQAIGAGYKPSEIIGFLTQRAQTQAPVAAPMAAPAVQQPGVPRPIGVPEPPAPAPVPAPGMMQQLIGEAEALGSLATAGTTGLIGGVQSGGRALAQEILSGQFGTPDAARRIEEAVTGGMRGMTYQPRTQTGQEVLQRVGGAVEMLPPVLPIVGPAVVPGAAAARQVGTEARAMAQGRQALPMVERVEPTLTGVPAAAPAAAPSMVMRAEQPPVAPPTAAVGRGSAGAAGVPVEMERRAIAASMPVPFTGQAGLTKGQASRDFAQLQFEKESAKLADMGQPLRERGQQQTATFIQNFDALIDLPQPISREKRGIGILVDKALVDKAEVKRTDIRKAYKEAERAGEMRDPVELDPLAATLTELDRFEGVAKNIPAVRREAQRLGAISIDEAGNLQPGRLSIADSETLRQFVNEATDWTDRREALFGRKINASIDAATEGKGGELYKKARKLRADFASEFENVGLTSKLLGTKRGTDERQIAFEDVFDKVIVLSPVDEMNKLRRTLLTAGPDGKQAWSDLKAKGIEYIKDASFSPSQRDAAGNPLLSPDKLQKVVRSLDESGKLESLYGKKQAQTLRDLADLATVIYTAPPGAINTSNTSSAILNALDTGATFLLTNLPLPAKAVLSEAAQYLKDRKLKARIKDALREPTQE